MKRTKIIASMVLTAVMAASACMPAAAAEPLKPLPPSSDYYENWYEEWYDAWYDIWYEEWYDDWYDDWFWSDWYADYYVKANDFDGFYEPSSATIYHDGHGNFTTSGSGIISSDSGVITVIPATNGTTLATDNNGYPIQPSGWQGNATTGGGSYTSGSTVMQSNGQLGTLTIKGRSINVYEGTSDSNLLKGGAHFTGTSAWDGNVCIAGHNRGPNAWFSDLISLSTGDVITYSTSLGTRVYRVSSIKVVSVHDLSPLNASDTNMLTLVTCLANQPSVRLIVQAQCA